MNHLHLQSTNGRAEGPSGARDNLSMDRTRLREDLLARIPVDGTPISVGELASNTCIRKSDVTEILFNDYTSGHLCFDVLADNLFKLKPSRRAELKDTSRFEETQELTSRLVELATKGASSEIAMGAILMAYQSMAMTFTRSTHKAAEEAMKVGAFLLVYADEAKHANPYQSR
jgi:hypothetical protein